MTRQAALLETLLAAATVLTAVTLVALPMLGPGGLEVMGGPLLTVDATLSEPVAGLPSLEDGGSFGAGDSVELGGLPVVTATVFSPSWDQRLGLVGGRLVGGLTALGVLALLWRISRSLRRGEVFTRQNARRLSAVALIVGIGGTAAQLLTAFGTVRVLDAELVRGSVTPVFELSFLPLFAALGVGVLAEVFRQGTALREDVEGLV